MKWGIFFCLVFEKEKKEEVASTVIYQLVIFQVISVTVRVLGDSDLLNSFFIIF